MRVWRNDGIPAMGVLSQGEKSGRNWSMRQHHQNAPKSPPNRQQQH